MCTAFVVTDFFTVLQGRKQRFEGMVQMSFPVDDQVVDQVVCRWNQPLLLLQIQDQLAKSKALVDIALRQPAQQKSIGC